MSYGYGSKLRLTAIQRRFELYESMSSSLIGSRVYIVDDVRVAVLFLFLGPLGGDTFMWGHTTTAELPST